MRPREEGPPEYGGPSSPRFAPRGLQLGTAQHEVHACAGIGADTAEADVKAATTAEAIVAPVSRELIVVTLASKPVRPFAPRNLVLAEPTEHAIAALAGENLIAPVARTDQVVAATALNLISAAACNDHVATDGSPEWSEPDVPVMVAAKPLHVAVPAPAGVAVA
jgi:hypothetical protein